MSIESIRGLDARGQARVSVAAVGLTLGLVLMLTRSPIAAIGAAGAAAVLIMAVALQSRANLTPLWPLAFVAFAQPLNGIRPLPFVAIGDILLIITLLAVLLLARQATFTPRLWIMFVGTVLVTAGGILGMMVAQDWGGVAEMAKFVLGAPVVLIIVMLINPDRSLVRMMAVAYALGATLSAIDAIFEPVDPAFGRSNGFGAHAGHLALSSIFAFFVFVGVAVGTRSLLIRFACAIGAFLGVVGILLSGTRSALIGFVIGVVFVALAARMKGILTLGGGIAIMGLLYFTVVPLLPFKNNIQRAFGQGELASSTGLTNGLHEDLLNDALRLIGTHPWSGVGFTEGQVAHNLILQVASMGGIIALIGLIVTWAPVFFAAAQRLEEGINPESALRVCMMAGVLAYFVFAQFQPLIWDRHLWFFIGITMYIQLAPPVERARSSEVRRGELART